MKKELPSWKPFFAVSASLAGEKNGVEDHNGSGGLMQGEQQRCGAGHARRVEGRQQECDEDKTKKTNEGGGANALREPPRR